MNFNYTIDMGYRKKTLGICSYPQFLTHDEQMYMNATKMMFGNCKSNNMNLDAKAVYKKGSIVAST